MTDKPTMTLWSQFSDRNKSDYYLVKAQVDIRKEHFPDATDFKKYDDLLYKLEQQAQKANDIAARAKMVGEGDEESLIQQFVNVFKNQEIYFIAKDNKIYEYSEDEGLWREYSVEAAYRYYGAHTAPEKLAMMQALEQLDRNKKEAMYTFKMKDNNNILNQFKMDNWVQPEKGDVPIWFDLLLASISGGSEEVSDHIEQCVYWKYTHPEEYELPCIMIYGNGGAGKGTFVTKVLSTIFGSNAVARLLYKEVFGDFNGQLQGKVVVFIDENAANKADGSKMKAIVGQPNIPVNVKGGAQKSIENTAWFWTGGNNNIGPIYLDGHGADRRWTIVQVKRSVIDVVSNFYKVSHEEAVKLWEDNMHVLHDPVHVAAWLESLFVKWSGLENKPVALHTATYDNLVEAQQSEMFMYFEAVFKKQDFDYIRWSLLYEGYREWMKKYASPRAKVVDRKMMGVELTDWLAEQALDVEERKTERPILIERSGGQKTSTTGWALSTVAGRRVSCSDHRYTVYVQYGDNPGKNVFDIELLEMVRTVDEHSDEMISQSGNKVTDIRNAASF